MGAQPGSRVESNLSLQMYPAGEWRPPILKTEATTGRGVTELWTAIQAFRAQAAGSSQKRQQARGEFRLRELLTHRFLAHLERQVFAPGEFQTIVNRIARREVDPYSAAAEVFARAVKQPPL